MEVYQEKNNETLDRIKTIEAYKECIKKGIKIKMIVSMPEVTKEKIKPWKKIGVELRGVDLQPAKFSVIDENEITIVFVQSCIVIVINCLISL